jgi:Tol biopolymer transport system component
MKPVGWRTPDSKISFVPMSKVCPSVLAAWLAAWFAGITTTGCNADLRSLGTVSAIDGGASTEVWIPFGTPTLHPALANTPASQENPSLTADELELYYATAVDGSLDIWLCQRASSTSAWGSPGKVIELSGDSMDEQPEVSADGLTMYLASDRPGGAAGEHLWVSRRASRAAPWGQLVPVTDFALGDADMSPSLQQAALMMTFSSQRGSTNWQLFVTTRPSTTDPWGAPVPLAELNSSASNWASGLYREGTSIVFSSNRVGGVYSLFHATRASITDSFSAPQASTELNGSTGNDNDPWLSNDGHHIVFDSQRNGRAKIYEAWR